MSLATSIRHAAAEVTQRLLKGTYAPGVPRINLILSTRVNDALVEQARRVGLSKTALAREHVARGVGFDEGRESDRELRREIKALQKRLDALERDEN